MNHKTRRLSSSIFRLTIETIVALTIATMVILACNLLAFAEEDEDVHWVAGAIASEAYSQPYDAQCGIGRIVAEEATRRHISVKQLATETNYLSGWQWGGEWHKSQYLNPEPRFKDIAKNSIAMVCSNWNARYFDGKYPVVLHPKEKSEDGLTIYNILVKKCKLHPDWSKIVRLLKEIAGTCFYGYE